MKSKTDISSATADQSPTRRRKALAAKPALKKQRSADFLGRFNEALLMAWRAMVVNKMRTLPTMLGIIIGIASVVTILRSGMLPKHWCCRISKSIGTKYHFVYPGKDFGSDPGQISNL